MTQGFHVSPQIHFAPDMGYNDLMMVHVPSNVRCMPAKKKIERYGHCLPQVLYTCFSCSPGIMTDLVSLLGKYPAQKKSNV